jgi:hypothetical protein
MEGTLKLATLLLASFILLSPAKAIARPHKAYGIGSSPYTNVQDPNHSAIISTDQIVSRPTLIAPYSTWVRTFKSTHGLEHIPATARQRGLKVAATDTLAAGSISGHVTGGAMSAMIQNLSAQIYDAAGTFLSSVTTDASANYALDAANRGWYLADGFSNGAGGSNNYVVGDCNRIDPRCPGGGPGPAEWRNWFRFDLSSVSGSVTAATLVLNVTSGFSSTTSPTGTYTLFDISPGNLGGLGTNSQTIWADIGSGISYGSYVASSANSSGTTIAIPLNAAALAAINASVGSSFALGGAITTLQGGSEVELLFGGNTTAANHTVLQLTIGLAPTGLTVSKFGASAARLTWNAAPGAASYNIKRGSFSRGETLLASGVAGTSYVDNAVALNTTYYYVVSAVYGLSESGNSNEVQLRLTRNGDSDYDNDGKADLALYRPSNGHWYILQSSTNYATYLSYAWGIAGDIAVAGDYDGDGRVDLALYRPSNGVWYVLLSSTNYTSYLVQQWGIAGDIPVPGDYDGDGKTDIGLYRPSAGIWYIKLSSTNYATYIALQWGINGDMSVTGDYDGDGKTDLGLYRPSNGYWYVLLSSTNYTSYLAHPWGIAGDVPVPGDYDGDGKSDMGLYRRSAGIWYILQSSTSFATYAVVHWGLSTDLVLGGDYDGDGRSDLALYRPSNGHWYILESSSNYTTYIDRLWGIDGDIPILQRR